MTIKAFERDKLMYPFFQMMLKIDVTYNFKYTIETGEVLIFCRQNDNKVTSAFCTFQIRWILGCFNGWKGGWKNQKNSAWPICIMHFKLICFHLNISYLMKYLNIYITLLFPTRTAWIPRIFSKKNQLILIRETSVISSLNYVLLGRDVIIVMERGGGGGLNFIYFKTCGFFK